MAMEPMVHLDGQRQCNGGFGGGWLEDRRQRLGTQWAGLIPREC